MSYTPPSDSPPAKRRYGGISGEERSRQRRERFLEAALEVFGKQGFSRATMRDICAEARLAERYFYENFSSLADTFEAIFQQLSDQLTVSLEQAMTAAPKTMTGQATAGLKAFYQFVRDDPRRAQIMLMDAPQFGHSNLRNNGASFRAYAILMRRTAQVIGNSLPGNVNLELVASGLIGMMMQICITWYHSGFEEPIDSVVEHTLYAWKGLERWFGEVRPATAGAGATAKA